ncbi:hypothetical protein BJP40_02125 [Streptomyces sp. CC53]|uniref:acyl carrier protein n=1 Tax=Streptomyces sp. CC53 TaxID=1906740 RepID=UPI0008DD0C54|nr:acyl carrier protein [Streptomyces sp. CC53]OII64335.1 hypothetical protein BJP40_02125 [Streptomyces sp. CC53]
MDTIHERVIKIVAEQMAIKEEEVTPGKLFRADLKVDDIEDFNVLISSFEEEFQIDIPDQDQERLMRGSVEEAILYVRAATGRN